MMFGETLRVPNHNIIIILTPVKLQNSYSAGHEMANAIMTPRSWPGFNDNNIESGYLGNDCSTNTMTRV